MNNERICMGLSADASNWTTGLIKRWAGLIGRRDIAMRIDSRYCTGPIAGSCDVLRLGSMAMQ